ncbi:hypothetical protein PC119_g20494 [Phytophthora cactorum]|nr:hypothetical protein PC114_g21033 [Phytophthora cactorum]KAG2984032.1 hypothetical protein PC119_g20494 [Phytophthora cactorum]KAG3164236.1 hypothetical protein PC128_g20184 [Phytophthora cactorum]
MSVEEQIDAIAARYVQQRTTSLKDSVTTNMRVRPAHIKSMVMHAREMVFVLDVDTGHNTRMQAYTYKEVQFTAEQAIETGMVNTIESDAGVKLQRELVAAHTLPVSKLDELATTRNDVMKVNGARSLDPQSFDPKLTVKAVSSALKRIRRAAKSAAAGRIAARTEYKEGRSEGHTDGCSAPAAESRVTPGKDASMMWGEQTTLDRRASDTAEQGQKDNAKEEQPPRPRQLRASYLPQPPRVRVPREEKTLVAELDSKAEAPASAK